MSDFFTELAPLPDAPTMRAADEAAIAAGAGGGQLMARAADGLADVVARELPDGLLVVLCGKGNNGGDGYAAAQRLRAAGRELRVVALAPVDELTGEARGA
ncbi:MAG: bifunctional ADP-dependent NAD(P)H-hydrate dehydratase/NAD(P)H-hydrate epimerase, partial [Solirubrobacterales bacterium]|nr:bifunctional ADP-dependent NAD(P)H-hydrate dehydratase/NAD(P)H-hydrate epimerase [Solirubrobacterales bacterium]